MSQVTSSSSVTSFATELAELLVQAEANESDSDRVQRNAARASFLENAQHQVDALHAAAKATETGALVSAAFTIAGGACQIGGAVDKYDAETKSADLCAGTQNGQALTAAARHDLKDAIAVEARDASILQSAGKGLSDLAAPAKSLLGDATAMRDNADAKKFETLGAQAQWQANDATTALDKRDKLGDKLLDLMQSLEQDQSSSANAVIGRI